MSTASAETVSVADLVAAVRRQQAPRTNNPPQTQDIWRGVSVVGAHPGAGATAVAIALSDALDELGLRATLLDMADEPDAFAAVECEINGGHDTWRAGRRGEARVLRHRSSTVTPSEAPETPYLIVDGRIGSTDRIVLVCRATLPSIRRAEVAVADDDIVGVVGVSRWPKVVGASLGPRLRRAAEDERVVFVPFDRDLALHGVDADPMPRSVTAAGRLLVELLWPEATQQSPAKTTTWRSR